jgi:DNA-binding MarR family transcriptional regulator
MKRGNFSIVQNQIFDYKLSPIAFYVYCYLCKCRNKKNGCYPSKQTIASACSLAVSSVSKAIKQLSDAGLIAVTKNFMSGRQINNSYEITDLCVCETDNP